MDACFLNAFFWSRPSTRRHNETVQRYQVKFVLSVLMLSSTSAIFAAAPPGAAVSGVVRDNQGVAQMGALVQILTSDSAAVATAFTDLHGRYVIAHLIPGKYQVRASAALFAPVLRENLLLRGGNKLTVNLTLNGLFETATWLPAQRRKADEPSDDWRWTLRSAASRPILRMVDDDGNPVLYSSSVKETSRPVDEARASVTGGGGEFGGGGIHNVMTVDRILLDGADVLIRTDIGSVTVPLSGRPSTELQAGYQRLLGFAGAARTVVSIQSHPEIVGSGGVSGLNVMQTASAQRMSFGDMADVEVGNALNVVRTAGYVVASRPFLRVAVHPSENWTMGYGMATAQSLQGFDGLDTIQPVLPVAVLWQGHMQMEGGVHQEFYVSRKAGKAVLKVGYYRDALDRVAVAGGGGLTTGDLKSVLQAASMNSGILADTKTDSFRFLAAGYKAQGINVALTAPIVTGLWAAFDYGSGSALTSGDSDAATLPGLAASLKPHAAQSATLALKGNLARTGTKVRAAYRWQPSRMVTAIDPYAAFSDQAFLSFYVHQHLKCGDWLPPGLEATIDVTNLLAEGYRPFLSADGHTLYLAQSPRTLQAGLAFTF